MPEHQRNRRNQDMASTELPGKGEYFVVGSIQKDEEYGTGGALWIVSAKVEDELHTNGLDGLLRDDELSEFAAPVMIAQGVVGERPGVMFDFYNDPDFDRDGEPFMPQGKAFGIVDELQKMDKNDPARSMLREVTRSILSARAAEVSGVPDMRIEVCFFDKVEGLEEMINAVFGEYNYQIAGENNRLGHIAVELTMSTGQFND